ncbi:LAXTG-anchored chaplin ChpA [Streptomyces sp. AD681]|uniref:LAXTG-anchored chaplin ChpA n=1 Tax=Streptomyces sp. AD681 TaxID=3019069 RepID=UPI0022F16790|nr:LAXTG-anchored chaplin ChpA [Streptomyces sp. AD681]MDA5144040.1 LAXTG-anchored chaplin ChpA [Streptomyces sp. AD681]
MRQTLSRGMVAAAAATGILSLCGSPALADSHADGAATNSPGAVSGNALQIPVDVPVNACGNTVDVIAALNPAFGNECENTSDEQTDGNGHGGGYGEDTSSSASSSTSSSGGSHADGATVGSPGVGSGNNTQVPVDVPVNLCGNTVDVIAALNPVFGNKCENEAEEPPGYGEEEPPPPTTPPGYGEEEPPPPTHEEPPPPSGEEEPPPPSEEEHTPPAPQTEQPPVLAETGSEGTLGAAAAGAVLIAGGAILYRRGRALSGR